MGWLAQSMFITCLLISPSILTTVNTGWFMEYLTDLSSLLKDGIPSAGIPKVDPLPVNTNLNVRSDMFSGDVSLQGELFGFSNYFVTNAALNPNLNVNLDLVFLSTTFEGYYSLNGSAYKRVFPLSGSGPIQVYFSFIRLSANGTLVGRNEMLQIKDFNFEIKEINAVEVTADGLLKEYGLNQVLAPSIKGVLNTAIKLFKPQMEELINTVVMSNGNQFLRQLTVSKVLELIKQLFHESTHGVITFNSDIMDLIKRHPPH